MTDKPWHLQHHNVGGQTPEEPWPCEFREYDGGCSEPATWVHVYAPRRGERMKRRFCDEHTGEASIMYMVERRRIEGD